MRDHDDETTPQPERPEEPVTEPAGDAPTEPITEPAGEGPTEPAPEPAAEEPTQQRPTEQRPGPRRLMRTRDDRVIAGVSGGLGRHFDVDPVIFRISFVVTLFFGGLGVLAYLIAWLVLPLDEGGEGVGNGNAGGGAQPARLQGAARVVAMILLAFVLFAVFCGIFTLGAFLTGIGWGLAVVALIVLLGAALIAISLSGGSRWLILPVLALALGAGAAAAVDLDLEGGIGERDYRPQSVAAIAADGYEIGIGRLTVDLRGIDWKPSQVLPLEVSVGAGQAVVAVPADVCVVAGAHARAGNLQIAGQETSGFDVESDVGTGTQATPRLELDGDVDAGQIQVINDDRADISDGRDWDHEDWDGSAAEMRTANERACAG